MVRILVGMFFKLKEGSRTRGRKAALVKEQCSFSVAMYGGPPDVSPSGSSDRLDLAWKEQQQKRHYFYLRELQNMARELPGCSKKTSPPISKSKLAGVSAQCTMHVYKEDGMPRIKERTALPYDIASLC
ncbi:hypothetical protein LSAT2_024727 [Lamellibrachia satsuma]|nr:hypothetical protein LSAT2_024727 [Lamellibrachia satsuma]